MNNASNVHAVDPLPRADKAMEAKVTMLMAWFDTVPHGQRATVQMEALVPNNAMPLKHAA
jgi:hypothetical protein